MAGKKSGYTEELEPNIKPSNTGHKFDPAYKAPLSAKNSVLLGGEQTSDAAKVEKKITKSRTNKKIKGLSEKAKKRRDLNLESHLDRK